MESVLRFVEENDVKFIRLAFCDLFGTLKNVSVMPGELPRAFEQGVSFDGFAVRGFGGVEHSDLFLRPDPSTLQVLPWRPSQGRVCRMFCDVCRPDGEPFPCDGRTVLKKALARAARLGYTCKIGTECEFYLFEAGGKEDVLIPCDQGGYCDIAPLDKGENIRREICLTLEEMGICPESSHHEQGPGQNEIDFRYSGALTAADNLLTFKSAVRSIAALNGLYASFLPKPFGGKSGSGLHVNLSLHRGDRNLFDGEHPEARSFLQGILDRVGEITAFLNPLTNSYERFGAFEAPKYIGWSRENRSQLVRIPAARGQYCRMELRSPDPACNPYLAFALIIEAGLDGIDGGLPLSPSTDGDLYASRESYPLLPENLGQALSLARESAFVRRVLPGELLESYCSAKAGEYARVMAAKDRHQEEMEMYFSEI